MQFVNPQEAEAKVAARYQVMFILWIAMLISVGLLFALAFFVPSSGTANQTLSFALLGAGFSAVAVSLILKSQLLRKAIEKQQVEALVNAYIIAFALCESAALFGLMDHFVTGSGYYRFGFILAGIGMLLHFPKKEHLRAVSYKQF